MSFIRGKVIDVIEGPNEIVVRMLYQKGRLRMGSFPVDKSKLVQIIEGKEVGFNELKMDDVVNYFPQERKMIYLGHINYRE